MREKRQRLPSERAIQWLMVGKAVPGQRVRRTSFGGLIAECACKRLFPAKDSPRLFGAKLLTANRS